MDTLFPPSSKRISLMIILWMTTCSLNAQQDTSKGRYRMIPEECLNHPELGLVFPKGITNDVDYELIHLRDVFSRTFLNKSGSLTTVRSSAPLHYKDATGKYLTLDYRLTTSDGKRHHIPSHHPTHHFDSENHEVAFYRGGEVVMVTGLNRKINMYGANDDLLMTLHPGDTTRTTAVKEKEVMVLGFFAGTDLQHIFYENAYKTNYLLMNSGMIHPGAAVIMFSEEVTVPNGWNFVHEMESLELTGRLILKDPSSKDVYIFQHPVIRDSKQTDARSRHQLPQHQGVYSFLKINDTTFILNLAVDAGWILDPSRVFPVIIDPMVVLSDTSVLNSCFYPNYQQGALTLNVPVGHTIYNTYLEWDFVATTGSGAWKSDQSSYVSGPNSQTAVVSGTGDVEGIQTYVLDNTYVANGTSTGTVTLTFYASRTWGGSGCNATFNFINKRYIEITHDQIIFGPGQVIINEYSASNRALHDGFGRTEDWVELWNPTANYVNLAGYHLSDNPNNPLKWQISSGFIPPNGKVLVFCSGRDISSGVVFHANFRLSQLKPEHLILSDPQGNMMESYVLWRTQNGHSYGRTSDGATQWGVFETSTPYQVNVGSKGDYASTPVFSVSSGHYATAQTVGISPQNPNEHIRYTLNGSEPGTGSALYTNPLLLNQTTVIRARSFPNDTTLLPGFIETGTYFINENHSLPMISISGNMDLPQLFGGNASLNPVGSFEYFDKYGTLVDKTVGDFNKHGNDSWSYPQRGADFVSRDEYGYNDVLRHTFFSTTPRGEFQRLILKAAANDNYPFESGGAHIRDSYVQTLAQVSGLNLDERSSVNVVLYLNGQYHGVYDLREKVDDHDYTDFYYGQDRLHPESDLYLQFLKTWGSTQAEYGNQPAEDSWALLRQYVQNNHMNNPTHFALVDSLLDIESLIDYFVLNSFVVSRDWLNYNTGWWRGLNPQGDARKWRYILWDQEGGLGHYINFTGMPNVTALANPCQVESLTVANNGHVQILSKLINQNPQVRQRYITRYADLLNTHFSCSQIIGLLDSMVAVISPEMPRHILRWSAGTMTEWQNNVQEVRSFLQTRCSSLVTSLASCYNLTGPFPCTYEVFPQGTGRIKMNSEWLPVYPFQAQMYGNIETLLRAEAIPGYDFSHWEADSVIILNINASDISVNFTHQTRITAHFKNPNLTNDSLIHYWHFNVLSTPTDVKTITADYSLIPGALPLMTYQGTGPRDIDVYNSGSDLNLHQLQLPGTAARVRNPSTGRSLDFDLPTTGYADIKFDYSVHRSGQGMLKNIISYSIDGINFIQTGLQTTEFNIEETYQMVSLDFTGIPGVDHNPDFKVRITFWGNTTTSNGNNRFDNVSLRGVPTDISVKNMTSRTPGIIKVYPNPCSEFIHIEIIDAEAEVRYRLIDLSGRVISSGLITSGSTVLDMTGYKPGLYFLQVKDQLFKTMIMR